MAAKKHSWNYENIGGSTRVKISTGADIAHLAELDIKKWTVLSCPTVGLDIDEKSLRYIDTDNDGRIRVNDVIVTSQWLTAVVKDVDLLVKGADCIDVEQFNQANADGAKLYKSAKQILVNLAKEGKVISLADTNDITAIFAKTRFNGDGVITEQTAETAEEKAAIAAIVSTLGGVADRCGMNGANAELIEKFYQALADYLAWNESMVDAPYGADTDKAIEAYNALDVKIKTILYVPNLPLSHPRVLQNLMCRLHSLRLSVPKTSPARPRRLLHILLHASPARPNWTSRLP